MIDIVHLVERQIRTLAVADQRSYHVPSLIDLAGRLPQEIRARRQPRYVDRDSPGQHRTSQHAADGCHSHSRAPLALITATRLVTGESSNNTHMRDRCEGRGIWRSWGVADDEVVASNPACGRY